jgi:glycerol-3-phosphate dehydrogenase (NAD(P)+)
MGSTPEESPAATKRIAVVGLGAWGTALAVYCARLGHSVVAWHRNVELVSSISSSGSLPFLGGSIARPVNLSISSDLAACKDADATIVALPARAWREVLPSLEARLIISATKGLDKESAQTPLSFVAKELKRSSEKLAVISGPSFASDLAGGRPISMVAACSSQETAMDVADMLSSASVRLYASTDPLGVELGGILKNVIAIAAGVSDALGYGPSARAALISRGLAEMMRLACALGADSKTLFGLSGLGDLIMTATEDQSRNRTVGLRLGRGEKIGEIAASLGATAEGVTTAPLALELARKAGIDVPITEHVVKLLNVEIQAAQMASALMTRPLKREF